MTLALMAVIQEVNNFESSVVVQELEFAMNNDEKFNLSRAEKKKEVGPYCGFGY